MADSETSTHATTAAATSTSASNVAPPHTEETGKISDEVVAELIAAHKQPANAIHYALGDVDYLAASDVCMVDATPQDDTPGLPPHGSRIYTRTVHLETSHIQLQGVLAGWLRPTHRATATVPATTNNDDVVSERWQKTDVYDAAPLSAAEAALAFEEEEVYLERESRAIQWLQQNQVPLLYTPSPLRRLLRRVRDDPERFVGMLRPFYLHPPMAHDAPEICFFERQALRWQEFVRFQANNRGIDTTTRTILRDAYIATVIREADSAADWKRLIADPDRGASSASWAAYQRYRAEEKECLRDVDCNTFAEYVEGVRERLKRHAGLEVPELTLTEDFRVQDRLARWSEYLAFEYWHSEHYDAERAALQNEHDEAYARLQTEAQLRPHETPDYLPSHEAKMQRRLDKDMAYSRYDHAQLALARLHQQPTQTTSAPSAPRRGRLPAPPRTANNAMTKALRQRQLAEREAEVAAAEEAKDVVLRRERLLAEFLRDTDEYRAAREVCLRHEYLLAWTRDKYSEICAELRPEPRVSRVSFASDKEAAVSLGKEEGKAAQEPRPRLLPPPALVQGFPLPESPSPLEPSPVLSSSVEESSADQRHIDPRPVGHSAVDAIPVNEPLAEQPLLTPQPPAANGPPVEMLPVVQPSEDASSTVAPAPTRPVLRRSARIAAKRQKVAEQAAAMVAAQSARVAAEAETRSTSGGKKVTRIRKRGRGNAEEEERSQDAQRPVKRTRRRTAKK